MAITNYTELQSAVASWAHRSDLTSVIQDCIALAESRFNDKLRTRHQEMALSATAINASYQISLPTYTVSAKQLWLTTTPFKTLDAQTLEYVTAKQVSGHEATAYAWEGDTWRFDGTGTVAGVLYRSIPPIATSTTNWLLTAHPKAYLYAALAELAIWLRDMEAYALWEGQAAKKIEEINRQSKVDSFSGPLQIVVR